MKLKLSQVFALSLVGLTALLGLLFYVVVEASRETLMESSERIRDGVGREVSDRVARFLAKAPDVARQVQGSFQRGLINLQEPLGVEAALFAPLLADADIGEVTLTYGRKLAFDSDGEIQLAPEGRGQLSLARLASSGSGDVFWSRRIRRDETSGLFVADRRELAATARLQDLPWQRETSASEADPTTHLTFTVPARQALYGQLLPSDLHWSQLDEHLPPGRRRVEVSVQQVVTDAAGEFVGVLRVRPRHRARSTPDLPLRHGWNLDHPRDAH
jgi:adenylate cyclase